MRSVQDVNCAGTTRLKLALLYWICRRSDKGRDRGRIRAVLVIRERETCSLPERYRDRDHENRRVRDSCSPRTPRFENSRNVEVSDLFLTFLQSGP
jgi:hypothetical protein